MTAAHPAGQALRNIATTLSEPYATLPDLTTLPEGTASWSGPSAAGGFPVGEGLVAPHEACAALPTKSRCVRRVPCPPLPRPRSRCRVTRSLRLPPGVGWSSVDLAVWAVPCRVPKHIGGVVTRLREG